MLPLGHDTGGGLIGADIGNVISGSIGGSGGGMGGGRFRLVVIVLVVFLAGGV